MGVPSLFRWFEKKFPGVVRKPDPKLDTCDNLYVDANSIIHNVCHPGHRPPPSTEEQMMVEIEAYLTHVIKTAKPTKLVFIAIDGVAPQAKISQQRTRRFRAAKEASEIKDKKALFIKEAREQGIRRYDKLASGDDWDSNAITPGTPFMAKLDAHLNAWILRKPKTDPFFVPLAIILSGSAVPGEGEHKAMDFIRRQRCQPGYQPLKHAFYGPDADLILLALATHEPSFRILREDPREKHDIRCIICQAYGHAYKACPAIPEDWSAPSVKDNEEFTPPRLIFFDVWLLRIALETYLKLPKTVEVKLEDGEIRQKPLYNHERSIDDFILIVALMGNDFIPHLPLPDWDISKGAINTAVDAWRISTINQKGYIVKNGKIRLDRLENLLKTLAAHENFPSEPVDEAARYPSLAPKKDSATPDLRGSSVISTSARYPDSHLWARHSSTIGDTSRYHPGETLDLPEGFPALAETSKAKSRESSGPAGIFAEYKEVDMDDGAVYEFFATKMTYYEQKLGLIEARKPETIRTMVQKYIEGLHWVMEYYCQGCPSWKWFYPFHYAPWPSDCVQLTKMKIKFTMSSPLPPFSQLMSVFPPSSAEHVPGPYRHFMQAPDSVLKDYYPLDFKTDRNGKVQEWKSVVLLSHIDPRRLQEALQPIWENRKLWSDIERMRNRPDVARIYVCDQGPTKNIFQKLFRMQNDPRLADAKPVEIAYAETGVFAGKVGKDPKLVMAEQINNEFDSQRPNSEESNGSAVRTISATYAVPRQITPHSCELLPNQPEMHFNYRLVSRMKRDPMRLVVREWPKGDNAGRDARAVAEEIATGIRPEFVNWTAKLRPQEEDDYEQPFEPLPYGFDDFIQPMFPAENETLRLFANMDLDEAEDEEERPDLQVQTGESSGTSSSNPFNRISTLPSKRIREVLPAQPVLTAAGYTKVVERKIKEEEDMSEDDDSSEDEAEKKKRKSFFKKKKPGQSNGKARQPSVKREYSDDDF